MLRLVSRLAHPVLEMLDTKGSLYKCLLLNAMGKCNGCESSSQNRRSGHAGSGSSGLGDGTGYVSIPGCNGEASWQGNAGYREGGPWTWRPRRWRAESATWDRQKRGPLGRPVWLWWRPGHLPAWQIGHGFGTRRGCGSACVQGGPSTPPSAAAHSICVLAPPRFVLSVPWHCQVGSQCAGAHDSPVTSMAAGLAKPIAHHLNSRASTLLKHVCRMLVRPS